MFDALELQTVLTAVDTDGWHDSWRAFLCVQMEWEARVLGGWLAPDDPVPISERTVTGYLGCSTKSARRWLQVLVGANVLRIVETGVGSRPTSYRVERDVTRWELPLRMPATELARRIERWQAMPAAEVVHSTKGKVRAIFEPSYARRHNGFVSASLHRDAQRGSGGEFVHSSMGERTKFGSNARRTTSDLDTSSPPQRGARSEPTRTTPEAARLLLAIADRAGRGVHGAYAERVAAVVTPENVDRLVASVSRLSGDFVLTYVEYVERKAALPDAVTPVEAKPAAHRTFEPVVVPDVIDLTHGRDELAAARSVLTKGATTP